MIAQLTNLWWVFVLLGICAGVLKKVKSASGVN